MASIGGLRALVVLAYGLGLCYGGFRGLAGLAPMFERSGVVATALAIAATAFFLGGAVYLARRKVPLPPRWFVPLALLAGLALRIAYALAVEPEWVGDYARYWQRATQLVQSGQYAALDIYRQRALPYLVPLVKALGPSPLSLKAGNIALLCLVQLLGYDIMRRACGHRAAQAFTLVWIGAAEPLFSSLIPSHDLVGVAFTVATFWGLQLVTPERDRPPRGKSILLAATGFIAAMLVLLQIQRGIGLLLLAVLLATAVSAWLVKRHFDGAVVASADALGKLVLIAALCVPAYAIGMSAARDAGYVMDKQLETYSTLRYTTAHISSLSDGSYTWMRTFHDAFSHAYATQPARFSDFRENLLLSDYAESPRAKLRNMEDRLKKQYLLGGSASAYWRGLHKQNPELLGALIAYNGVFSCAFALLSLVALARLLMRRSMPPTIGLVLVAVSTTALVLVLAAENQPRYLFFVWFAGACAIGAGLVRRDGDERPAGAAARLGTIVAQSLALFASVLLLAWLALAASYRPGSGRMLADWHIDAAAAQPGDAPLNLAGIAMSSPSDVLVASSSARRGEVKDFGPFMIAMELPRLATVGDRVDASKQVCLAEGDRTSMEFFLYTPYKNLGRRGAFRIELTVDGATKWERDLPASEAPVLVEVPRALVAGRCNQVAFTLRSRMTSRARSWQRASRVELFFPRLVAENS